MSYRIMRRYFGEQRAQKMTKEEAKSVLSGYCTDIVALLKAMWEGLHFRTAGGEWWIERDKSE